MKILLSNDDGVYAPGLRALYDALVPLGEVTVIAPDRNCSGASSSLTLENPLRVMTLADGFMSVKGTPSDCVHLALNGLLDWEPDIVVSGINAGANLGDDTIYSGTVAAAIEGRFLGLPSIAISMASREPAHYATGGAVAKQLVQQLLNQPLASNMILNVNVPDLPIEQLNGLRATRLGYRHRSEPVLSSTDQGGRPIYWIGPAGRGQDAGEGTDFHAVEAGYASVTPLQIDLTAHRQIDHLASWIGGVEQ